MAIFRCHEHGLKMVWDETIDGEVERWVCPRVRTGDCMEHRYTPGPSLMDEHGPARYPSSPRPLPSRFSEPRERL